MKALTQWLENRTGLGSFSRAVLYEHIPGGARWRYVWGSTLVFAFTVQMLTGIFLWMAYSPSSQTAWESVYYIQHEMQFGWLLRGVHHFTAQAMIVLLVLHLLQVVIDGAYRAPREVNFWLGLILMQIVLALSLTGYLLPWDQKGLWATKVATNLLGLLPLVGEPLKKIVIGGSQYGHHTLTRFFALHAGVLPGLLVVFLVMHVALFRRHGITTRPRNKPASYFWPDQVLRDAVAALAVMVVVLLLVIHFDPVSLVQGNFEWGQLGADLGAPADSAEQFAAARPEWYFLFLFQMLKYFKYEFIGAIVVPSLVIGFMFLMPFVGRWKLGHRFNIAFIVALIVAAGVLTWQAVHADRYAQWHTFDPEKYSNEDRQSAYKRRHEQSQDYLDARRQAEEEAQRVVKLIAHAGGIPPGGARSLLLADPQTMGPKLFEQHCASCHCYVDDEGQGIAPEEPTASNLYGFASREWLTGFLDPKKIATQAYFGNTRHADGKMVGVVEDGLAALDEQGEKLLHDLIVALSAEAHLPAQAELDAEAAEDGTLEAGEEAFEYYFGGAYACVNCHKIGEQDFGDAPDLTGYGSLEWLTEFIANPHAEGFYKEPEEGEAAMPAFAPPDDSQPNLIEPEEIDLIARWLRGEDPLLEPDAEGEGDVEAAAE